MCTCGCEPVRFDQFNGEVDLNLAAVFAAAGSAFLPAYASSENPHPIVGVDVSIPSGEQPVEIDGQLTFGGLVQPVQTWTVPAGSGGKTYRLALQADATTLASGHYDYSVEITLKYATGTPGVYTTVTQTFSGSRQIFNRSESEFGNRWGVPGLDQLDVHSGGVAVLRGNGTAANFASDGAGGYTTPEGSFSTFVQNGDGTYTLTMPYGDEKRFNSAGLLTSEVDMNGNVTTFSYIDADGDGTSDEISQVTEPFGRTFDYAWAGGLISSVSDFQGRTWTFSHNADGTVASITGPDPDSDGPDPAPTVTLAYDATTLLVSSMTDPLGRVTSFSYGGDSRLRSITRSDTSTVQIEPVQVQGLSELKLVSDVVATFSDAAGRVHKTAMDRYGYSTRSIDPAGNETVWERDANGLVTSLTEPDPDLDTAAGTDGPRTAPVTTYTHDEKGRLTGTTFADGTSVSWTFDPDSLPRNPTSFTDQLGHTWSYSYDSAGNLLSETDPDGNVTSYTYTAEGLLESLTLPDPDGAGAAVAPSWSFSYDTSGRPTTVTNPDTSTRTFTWDTADNLTGETDELSRTWNYSHDAYGRVIEARSPDPDGTGPLGRTIYGSRYDLAGRLVREWITAEGITDRSETDYDWDSLDNLLTLTLADPDGGGALTRPQYAYTYDALGNGLTEQDPLGNTTRWAYDSLSRPTSVTDALSNVTSFEWDNLGNLTASVDPLSNRTAFEYDAMSRNTAIVDALSGRREFQYDAAAQLTSESDELGRSVSYAYTPTGLVSSITDPAGNATSFSHDALGRTTAVTDALLNETTWQYDVMSRVTSVTDALGGVESFTWDAAGQLSGQTDPMNRTTTYEYNDLGELTAVVDPLSNRTAFEYDILGNQTKTIDPLGNETLREHDNLSRPIRVTDAEAGVTEMAYDAAGNMTSLTDSVGNTTSWAYDALNRPTSETNALNAARTIAYTAVGAIASVTDRRGLKREFSYDALHRPTEERWIASDGTTLVETVSFSYDAASQMTGASDSSSSYAFTHDVMGRVTEVDNFGTPNVPNVILTSGYDAVGNRTSLSASVDTVADFSNAYTFDALSRMTRITQTDGAPSAGDPVSDKRVDLAYNGTGQFSTITRYADQAGTQVVATSAYGYDGAGRLTSLEHTKGATVLASYSWAFDAASRITSFTSPDGTTNYTYDATHQLTGASLTNEAYWWDANGNPGDTGATVGANNRLLSDGTDDYEYDAEGNRTKKTTIATGEWVEYDWDHRNRLTAVRYKDSLGNVTKEVAYSYDMLNRLIEKEVDDTGDGIFDRAQRFVYDGTAIVLVFDDSGSLTNRLLHGPAVDQVFADEDGLGEILWAFSDNLGTVRDVAEYDPATDSTTVVNHRQFNSFGKITGESNPGVDFLFAFTGRYLDEDSGLQWNLNRWYDPETGRWLTEDPIGFAAGDANLNRYVGNSPTNFTDPDGLHKKSRWERFKRWFGGSAGDGADKVMRVGNGVSRGALNSFSCGQFGRFQDKFAPPTTQHNETAAKVSETVVDTLQLGKGLGKQAGKSVLGAGAKSGGKRATAKSQAELRKEAAEAMSKRTSDAGQSALSQAARRRLAKDAGDIPRSAQPVGQGRYGKGTKWWEYKDCHGKRKIVVEHPDGSVHVGTPKPQSLHRKGGPPKYYLVPGTGHIGQ